MESINQILEKAMEICAEKGQKTLASEHLLLAIADQDYFKQYFKDSKDPVKGVENVLKDIPAHTNLSLSQEDSTLNATGILKRAEELKQKMKNL